MTAPELIQKIEAVGGVLTLNGARIRYELPEDAAPMIAMLRQYRDEVLRLLRERERPERCHIHHAQTTWWTRADGSQVCGKCHPDPYADALEKTAQSEPQPMPQGVTLLQWAPERPPVVIERWAIVIDVPQFIQTTLCQLEAAMAGKNCSAGNSSVPEIHVDLNQAARIFERQRGQGPDALPVERFVPAFDFPVRLRVKRRGAHVRHPRDANELLEIPSDELRSVVGDDPRLGFRVLLLGSFQNHLFVGSRPAHLVTALIEALANARGEGDFGQL